jgi:transcriptional regulator with XRE-family HTH domain
MPTTSGLRLSIGRTPSAPEGMVSGYVLRLIREGLRLTQDGAAEQLQVDVNTVKGWETGRRPLPNVKVLKYRSLRQRLQQLGADAVLLDQLDIAIDVDVFLGQVLTGDQSDPGQHTLAAWVSTRAWNELLTWVLTGTPPAVLIRPAAGPRRGPVADHPGLAADDRREFFDNLCRSAELTLSRRDQPSGVLLRRQVYFIAVWDRARRPWLAEMERQELRGRGGETGWSPAWVAGRSLAVAGARQGDRDQLRRFIENRLKSSDQCEAANLNYWAYWIGEHSPSAASDDFMASGLGRWHGGDLFRHLTDELDLSTAYVELSIHSLWALLQRRPRLFDNDAGVTRDLRNRTSRLLDTASVTDLGRQSRRELEWVHFTTRLPRDAP